MRLSAMQLGSKLPSYPMYKRKPQNQYGRVGGEHPSVVKRVEKIREQLSEVAPIFNSNLIEMVIHEKGKLDGKFEFVFYYGRVTLHVDTSFTKRDVPKVTAELDKLLSEIGQWYTTLKDAVKYYPSVSDWNEKVQGDFGLSFGCVVNNARSTSLLDKELVDWCSKNIPTHIRVFHPDSYDEAHMDCLRCDCVALDGFVFENGVYLVEANSFSMGTLLTIRDSVMNWIETVTYWTERVLMGK